MRIDYNKDIIAAMLKQNEKKNEYEEQEQQQQQYNEERVEKLSKREIQILNCIKGQSRTEKQIAKMTRLDIIFTVSPLITELMLKGYVETIRRRRLFFSREYCMITVEGLAAL